MFYIYYLSVPTKMQAAGGLGFLFVCILNSEESPWCITAPQ